ncbi:MAG: hypothetical protein K2M55_01990 [Muribaculaceae bacterium]|nr:hypothetical protein [Muribaculaceae bacterium]
MFPDNDYLFPPVTESSRLLVGCRRQDYSASRIAHAIEDCNAHLLNLNVTSGLHKSSPEHPEGVSDAKFPIVCDIRVSHRNAESISRSLERYGYTVLEADDDRSDSSDGSDSTFRNRVANLLRYLEV